jgi:acetyl-CoA carboxylase biotin carboxyl carrier protein
MPFDHIEQISAWLAEAGIDQFELSGPDRRLRLGRAGREGEATDDAIAQFDLAEAEIHAQRSFTVNAPTVGILMHRHPMQAALLAPCGSRIRAGQTVALLQIGALLLPIDAPRDGAVTSLLVPHGTLVGYGTEIIELSATEREIQNEH